MIDYHSKVTFNIDDIKLSYKQKFFLKGLFLLKIFKAKKIITMNPRNPEAQYMSVLDGKIVQVGDLNTIKPEGKYELDKSFENYVLMPGLVEGHSHLFEGALWSKLYCGYFDRQKPDGTMSLGIKNVKELVQTLKHENETLLDPNAPLAGWGLDPIYFDDKALDRKILDEVSDQRPIGILHASGHKLNINSVGLKLAGFLRTGINHEGLPLGEDGLPSGEIRGAETIALVTRHVGLGKDWLSGDAEGLRNFGKICARAGVTTAADLANLQTDEAVEMMLKVTSEADFPARIVSLRYMQGISPKELIPKVLELKKKSTENLRLGAIKIVADGSIQGFTARLKWPGYYNGAPNGMWYTAPEHIQEAYELALENNILVHTHTNGDEATELALDCLEGALAKFPKNDHRFTLQHCQLASTAQFKRMHKLGMCANLFSNHHFYWGDEHYSLTVGPERAHRMNACKTALQEKVPLAIHSDAPVTPLGPLFTAWCAMNRLTFSGRTLGDYEKINKMEALYAITLGAAFTLKIDHEVGSLETGKKADCCVLEEDPFDIDEIRFKDQKILGTIKSGKPHIIENSA